MYNRAVDTGFTQQRFPFKHVYTGVDKTHKRALTLRALKKIKSFDFSGKTSLEFARDIFMFSFYTRGMSFKCEQISQDDRRDVRNQNTSYDVCKSSFVGKYC